MEEVNQRSRGRHGPLSREPHVIKLRGAAGALVVGLGMVAWAYTFAEAGDTADGFRRLHIDRLPVRWEPPRDAKPIILRYAIADRDLTDPEATNCGHMRAPSRLLINSRLGESAFMHAAAEAFSRWQDVAGISFEPAADVQSADIVIGEQGKPVGRAYTNVRLAQIWSGSGRPIIAAWICLNPEQPWKIGYDGNLSVYDLVHTLTHEIGHAIGLDHPSGRGHIMSFRYDESRNGLSSGDVLGAIAIYGPRRPTEAASTAPHDESRRRPRTPGDIGTMGLE